MRRLLRGLLDDAMARGEARADLDTALAADLLLALVDGVRPHVVSGELPPDRATDEVLRLAQPGLRTDRPTEENP